ncbi:MAG: hypothetical protein EZS28_030080, partial [Streblomastix strix]
RDRTESNSDISRIGMESNKCNNQNETKEAFTFPTRSIQYEKMDKDRNGDNSKINSQVNRKTKLSKTVILRSFTLPEYNGPSESISCQTDWNEYNDDHEQDCNIRYKLVDCETLSEHSSTINTDTSTNDNDSRCSTKRIGFITRERTENDNNDSWNLKQKIFEGNKQQYGNQNFNLKPTKFLISLKEFASSIPSDQKRQQYGGFRHQEMERFNIIDKGNQTNTLSKRRTRNLYPDFTLSRSQKRKSRYTKQTIKRRDYKLKEKIFQQTCLQMNLNLTIDLFSQNFNNLLLRFMSTIRGHEELAIDTLNQTWKKELPCFVLLSLSFQQF